MLYNKHIINIKYTVKGGIFKKLFCVKHFQTSCSVQEKSSVCNGKVTPVTYRLGRESNNKKQNFLLKNRVNGTICLGNRK